MRPAIALALIGSTMLCSGCALLQDGSRNLCHSICEPFQTHHEIARNRRWAEEAWCNISGLGGPCTRSTDYAQGFKDGYSEYLYRGGDGEPPLVAPTRYRHLKYQSPKGYLAIEDWFEGYRHGAGLARDSGARQFITGSSGLHGLWQGTGLPQASSTARDEQIIDTPEFHTPRVLPTGPEESMLTPPMIPQAPLKLDPITIAVDPLIAKPPEPARAKITSISEVPEPVRAKITNVSEAPEPVRVKIMKVLESPEVAPTPTKARITGISTPEPVRARITTITVAPKD